MRRIPASEILVEKLLHDPLTRTVTLPITGDNRTLLITIPGVSRLTIESPLHCGRFAPPQGCLFLDTSTHGQVFVGASEDVGPVDAPGFAVATVLISVDSGEVVEELA